MNENGEAQTDHEILLLLQAKINTLEDELKDTEQHLAESQEDGQMKAEQLALHEKLSAQHGILRSVFFGVVGLVIMMGMLVITGWVTKQTTIEREMAFFERILLVMIGIVGGAVSSFFDIRNFSITPSNNNNNNNKNNSTIAKLPVKDTD